MKITEPARIAGMSAFLGISAIAEIIMGAAILDSTNRSIKSLTAEI